MRHIAVLLLLSVSAAQSEDRVIVTYHPGNSISDRSVSITIDQSFDRRLMVAPEIFKRLKAINALETKSFVVPDAAYITITAEMGGRRLESSSCHTLFEANPKAVARSTGIAILDGISRKEALTSEPEHFLKFRGLWEESLSIAMKDVGEAFNPPPRHP